ncbi:sensor histidine kinase [Bdellovibrio reynosensis]|uniref:histidine kinase n=1 Tax=Bdellovibrio reynosensis TaxID=2835041 RepID=A0ABY4CA15_9BACT|nr:ATP-binding protein [Bdellovibrio reynosensis]UOF00521.1 ATP-binding protein [Bdellovibrio reynosensis]
MSIQKNHPGVLQIFSDQNREIAYRVDRAFSFLMLIQWLACILLGGLVAPQTWLSASVSATEGGLIGAALGAALALPAFYFSWFAPGEKVTRNVITVAQMCFSILLIFLTGGRAETHFHVFVSLAALSFYKDLQILWVACSIIVADSILRGVFLPMTVYGASSGTDWRWLENTLWVVFECAIMSLGIQRIRSELLEMAHSKFLLMSAREAADQASLLKSKFLNNMSHEIRTPLSSIIGFSDILRDTSLDQEQREYVHTINRCSESLLHLINDILDISKIENGLLQIDRHNFSFKELHEDVHRMFMVTCMQKKLDLELNLDSSMHILARGDSHRLRQVLINLVGNAVKFTEKGKVKIDVTKNSDGSYQWDICDTGRGISAENMEKLFQPFQQGHPSVARKYGGSGLGLTISKNLIELMGGNISVQSTEGTGTTFSFHLPLETVK